MIQINSESSFNPRRLERMVRNFNSGRYQFDTYAMQADIEKFQREAAAETDQFIKKNKENIAKYLGDIIIPNLNRFSRMRLKWCVDADGTIKTAPIRLLSMFRCGLNIIDYVYKTDEHTVELDYKELWDAMAFIIAHDDLCVSNEDIERVLGSCNIMSINNSAILRAIVEPTMYNDVNMMRIEHTEFVYGETYKDYFGNDVEEHSYKGILNSSVKHMMACVVQGLLENLGKDDYDVEFLGLFENRIYFNTNMDKAGIIDNLHQSILLKMFGRDFEFIPRIRIY